MKTTKKTLRYPSSRKSLDKLMFAPRALYDGLATFEQDPDEREELLDWLPMDDNKARSRR